MNISNLERGARPFIRTLLALGIASTCALAAAAEYRFTPEPVYPPDAAREIYQPLMDYLSQATGETFKLVLPANYSTYWRNILKEDITDFSYDEAHFADYRITRSNFVPLARTAEPTSYTLLADAEFEGKGVDALFERTIVTMPSPNLGYSVLMQFYPNPVHQPNIISGAASWRDAVQTIFSGEASAAIVPSWLIVSGGYPNLVAIKKSRDYSGPAVLAAPSVPEALRIKVRDALLELDDRPQLADLLMQLGISRFVKASSTDYSGDLQALEGFYGFK